MRVRTIAPAKINWTLEVLGKRPDGYHEIRSVMQTIDLCDEVTVTTGNGKWEMGNGVAENSKHETAGAVVRSGSATLVVEGEHEASEDDLTLRAVRMLEETRGRELPIAIRVVKRIPVGAGLGGGSSDAAATLRGLDRFWGLGLPREELARLATEIGADVTFFLTGGTALAERRGEQINPLLDSPETWLVVVAAPIWMQEKTKKMYEALRPEDFSDGGRTEALAERLGRGERVRGQDMCNAFERAAYGSFEGLAGYRDRLLEAGAGSVHLAGAGPALFAVFGSREGADGVAGRLEGTDARVFVARTLGPEGATRLEVR